MRGDLKKRELGGGETTTGSDMKGVSMRLLVVGPQHFFDYWLLSDTLDGMLEADDVLLHGCQRGTDGMTQVYAHDHGLALIAFPDNWHTRGKGLSSIVRMTMAHNADALVAFNDGPYFSGWQRIIDKMRTWRKPVVIINIRRANGEDKE
jgi:hypothetical protein